MMMIDKVGRVTCCHCGGDMKLRTIEPFMRRTLVTFGCKGCGSVRDFESFSYGKHAVVIKFPVPRRDNVVHFPTPHRVAAE